MQWHLQSTEAWTTWRYKLYVVRNPPILHLTLCVCLSERVFALLCLHILFPCFFKGLKLHANQFEPIDQEWG